MQVAGARPKSPAIERPTSPSRTAAFALSTCNFARPELMRRHTPNQPVPPSTFVDKARHVLGKPSSLAAPIATSPPRAAVPSSTQASISSTASYITESLIATPASAVRPARPAGGLLHRVKSWVHLDAPTSRAVSPASNAKAEFVALPGMDSTATLVGEPAPLKKAVILLEDDDLPEFAAARVSRSPPGLRRAEFRAPQASRLALDGHPAYGSRCRGRVVSARPPLFSPFGHAL